MKKNPHKKPPGYYATTPSKEQEAAWAKHKTECYQRWREETIRQFVGKILRTGLRRYRQQILADIRKFSRPMAEDVQARVSAAFQQRRQG